MKTNLNLYLLRVHNASARFTHDKILLTLSLLTLVFMFLTSVASAQTKTISGILRDAEQQALVGVSVSVKGTDQGVLTGDDGRFNISVDVSKHTVLLFSYIGKKSFEESIAEKTDLNLTMYDQPGQLIELVVTGEATVDQLYTETKVEKKRTRKVKDLH